MAHLETRYRCPACNSPWRTLAEAVSCRNGHPIRTEQWAVGESGKMVKVFENCAPNSYGSMQWALREADLSDDIQKRAKQLEELKKMEGERG